MTFRAAAALALAILVLADRAPAVSGAEPTPSELAAAIQRKYETVRDFSADFVQQQTSKLKRRLTERGKVWIKKPGKMRWEYKQPEEKLFVADGVNTYMYVPRDRQVFISPMPSDDQASTPVLFLAGKGNLLRDFVPALTTPPDGLPPGTLSLKLTPKVPQPEYDWLVLSVDPVTHAFRGLSTMDPQGALSTIAFTNLKENGGLAEQLFVFKTPGGVEVVTDVSRR
jgi:outer membrane lipoprotein carrier protein